MPENFRRLLSGRVGLLRDLRLAGGLALAAGTLGYARSDGSSSSDRQQVSLESGGAALAIDTDARCWAPVVADGTFPPPEALSIQFSAVVGSQVQGLATEASDIDRRGVFVAGARIAFSLDGSPEQIVHDRDQLCYWELGKFLRLALRSNPTVLETLYSPRIELQGPLLREGFERLRDSGALVSRQFGRAAMGSARAQMERIHRATSRGEEPSWPMAMHVIRLLELGLTAMRRGTIDVLVPSELRGLLLEVKRGGHAWPEVQRMIDDRVTLLVEAERESTLPAEPDASIANELLIAARMAIARGEWR